MPYPFKDKKIGNEYLLDEIRTRLEKGAKKYGEKILLDDSRNFRQEALEEAIDMAVYLIVSLWRLRSIENISEKEECEERQKTRIDWVSPNDPRDEHE